MTDIVQPKPIPEEEFKQRISTIQRKLREEGLDALFMAGDEFNQANIRYVSDYNPVLEFAGVIIPAEAEPVLLVGPECEALAKRKSKIKKMEVCSDLIIPGEEYPNSVMIPLGEIFKGIKKEVKIDKWGVVDIDVMPTFVLRTLYQIMGEDNIVDASHILADMRAVKSPNEIALIRQAYLTASRGLEVGVKNAKPGKKEFEVATEIAYSMRKEGVEQLSHVFMVASGVETIPALSRPSWKEIQDGEFVIIDLGAVYEGYYSDTARTFIAGKKRDRELVRIIDVACEAIDAALKFMRPGVKGCEVDKAGREVIDKYGYQKYMLYQIAHSVGLQHCEGPHCQPSDNGLVLQEGMIFALDLGLFNFPFGGMRMEEGVLITEDGHEILTKFPRRV